MLISRLLFSTLLIALTASIGLADPEDFIHQTAPQKWIDALLPESLPDLRYPAYFNDLDKAGAQWFHGGYKLALITLAKANPQTPAQIATAALIKGRSLAALGRETEALAALSDPATAADPHVQLERRR